MTPSPLRIGLAVVAAVGLAAPAAAQTTYTWAGTGADYAWGTPGNWSPAGPPNTAGAIALFNGTGISYAQVTGTFTVGVVRFDLPGGGQQVARDFASGGQLTLNNGASASVIEVLNAGVGFGQIVGPNLAIAGNNQLSLSAPTGLLLSLDGDITGTNSAVTVNAGGQGGTVAMYGANAFGGTLTVGGGILRADDGFGLSTGTLLVLSGGVLETNGDTTFTRTLGTAAGNVRLTGTAAGFSSFYYTLNVRLNNGNGTVTWGSADFNPGKLLLGGDGNVVFENGINLNGATRTVQTDSGVGDYRITGVISGATGGLRKEGAGTLQLTAANTYGGATTVAGGVLRANDGQGLPTASNLILDGGVLESAGAASFNRNLGTGGGQVQFGAGGGGFSAFGGPLVVQLNGNTAPVTWGTGGFVPVGSSLRLGSVASDALVDFRNGIDLSGGTRTVEVVGESPTARSRIAGVVSNGGLTVTGGGTLELIGANTYAGTTTVTAGTTLRANHAQGLPAASPLVLDGGTLESIGTATFLRPLGTAGGEVQVNDGGGFSASGGNLTVRLGDTTAAVTWGGANFVPAAGTLRFGTPKADGVVDFQNGLNLAGGTRSVFVADNPTVASDFARISGVVSNGGLTKTGPGTLELTGTNTYAGQTLVTGGALRATDGQGLPAASNLRFEGGVFEGTGTFTRSLGTGAGQVQWTADGGFAASSGTLEVNLGGQATPAQVTWRQNGFVPNGRDLLFGSATSAGVVDFRNPINLDGGVITDSHRSVVVTAPPGYAGVTARMSGVISDGGGGYSIFKYGNGTLEFTAANTFFGLFVEAGRVLANNTTGSGVGPGLVEVSDGGTLGGSGRIALVNQSATFNYGSRLTPGGGTDNSLRFETGGGNFGGAYFNGTISIRVLSAGAGGVAANSGASTAGTVPEPTNHTFLDLDARTAGGLPLADSFTFTEFMTWEVDGTGVAFVPNQRYSYAIGRVGAASEIDGGPLNMADPAQFVAVGFEATDWSVTSDANGIIYINFTPVPEPGAVLLVAGLSAGLLRASRRRTA